MRRDVRLAYRTHFEFTGLQIRREGRGCAIIRAEVTVTPATEGVAPPPAATEEVAPPPAAAAQAAAAEDAEITSSGEERPKVVEDLDFIPGDLE